MSKWWQCLASLYKVKIPSYIYIHIINMHSKKTEITTKKCQNMSQNSHFAMKSLLRLDTSNKGQS